MAMDTMMDGFIRPSATASARIKNNENRGDWQPPAKIRKIYLVLKRVK